MHQKSLGGRAPLTVLPMPSSWTYRGQRRQGNGERRKGTGGADRPTRTVISKSWRRGRPPPPFPGKLGYTRCFSVFFFHLFRKKIHKDEWHTSSVGHVPFLCPNRQHQSTEALTPTIESYPLTSAFRHPAPNSPGKGRCSLHIGSPTLGPKTWKDYTDRKS